MDAVRAYQHEICGQLDVQASSMRSEDERLESAWGEAQRERREIFEALVVGDVGRPVAADAAATLAPLVASATLPCEVLAVVEMLGLWPELEPDSYLDEVARDPPRGSVLVRALAVDAMGQTGRADYATALDRFISTSYDTRVVWHALRAVTTIMGDVPASTTSRVVDSLVFDDELVAGIVPALAPAQGPRTVGLVEELVGSDDRMQREAALRAASFGAGMPGARMAITLAGRSDLSASESEYLVRAIVAHGDDGADTRARLGALAENGTLCPNVRATALARVLAASGMTLDGALTASVMRSGPDPSLVVEILRMAIAHSEDDARSLVLAYYETPARRAVLEQVLERARDFDLLRFIRGL